MRGGTSLGRVRGLGSAKSGVQHWWQQRVTAAGNLLLVLWFVVSLILLPDLTHSSVVAWLKQPVAAVPMLLLIGSVCWHVRLGVQVLIEDYVHAEGLKLMSLLALNLYVVAVAAVSLFSVLKLSFGA
ncbi:succinate dehydrogenase, hydrophobic membrane anchor protein [Sandaracinobacteroides saxicola]|uniref:Succinate dehydrogenase hydrophobic membrane anchor subunit n=1 Tax=Sandaracinobacteroides saxicola TaxID=2759707 RepID=A0A7G5IEM5_9SPHN|nr:succinate dehydrogenase, hydrophobic membrane anchor protein [Sandaracinobacteroides saxicola]QMW21817.1 succinate dehydrogenase, hydrophobic membrane anchor protein [Sandaracinobacteroides saxicola]